MSLQVRYMTVGTRQCRVLAFEAIKIGVKVMQGITIADQTTDGFLAVNLSDILQAIAPVVLTSQWQISNLECFGQAAEQIKLQTIEN